MATATQTSCDIPPRIAAGSRRFNLTRRELQALSLLVRGATWKLVAATLKISISTVRFHSRNICLKTRSPNCLAALGKILRLD